MYTKKAQICIRRDTAANFTSANPTLALGEIAYETDTRNIKVGDGATAWTALGYINPYRGGTAAAPTSNTVLGSGAGAALLSGADLNTFVGNAAGAALTSGARNVAIGRGALAANTTGTWNTIVGELAAAAAGGWNSVTAIGNAAARFNTASDITAVGANALDANTTGIENTAVGKDALGANTTGQSNTAVGSFALRTSSTAAFNTAIGVFAGEGISTGGSNVLIGWETNRSGNTGGGNTYVGNRAGRNASSGDNNVAIGNEAAYFFGSGTSPITNASASIFIGRRSRAAADSQTNQIVIGHDVVGNGSNTTTIGNSSTTGTFIPAGNLTLTTGNFIVGTSGKGIDFSATSEGSGTMTSELLSDYEEGTWTPQIRFGGAGVGVTYSDQVARYRKIGNMVTVAARVNLSSKGSSTGIATLIGLPFTSVNDTATIYSFAPLIYNATFADVPYGTISQVSTDVTFYEVTNAGAVTNLSDADFTNTTNLIFTATYFT